jgi:hypothetical protein
MDPAIVAELAVEAVRRNRPYMINSRAVRTLLLRRFADLIEAFPDAADGPGSAREAGVQSQR